MEKKFTANQVKEMIDKGLMSMNEAVQHLYGTDEYEKFREMVKVPPLTKEQETQLVDVMEVRHRTRNREKTLARIRNIGE